MPFTSPLSLAKKINGTPAEVYEYSSQPANSVVFQNCVYLYWLDNADGDLYNTWASDCDHWMPKDNLKKWITNMHVATNTSPAPVVFGDDLYLFYNGYGNDGTWYAVYSHKAQMWTSTATSLKQVFNGGMDFFKGTSPSATVHDGKLWLFWNGSGGNGIFYTNFDGKQWSSPTSIPQVDIADSTSPYAISFKGSLHVFYHGKGGTEAMWTSYMNDAWQQKPDPVNVQVPLVDSTSPSALVLGDEHVLRMFWVGRIDEDEVQQMYYSDFDSDKETWSGGYTSLAGDMKADQTMLKYSGISSVYFQSVPWAFWVGPSSDIWYSGGQMYDLQMGSIWYVPQQCLHSGASFTLLVRDQLMSLFSNTLGKTLTLGPNTPYNELSSLVGKVFDKWDSQGNATVVFPALLTMSNIVSAAIDVTGRKAQVTIASFSYPWGEELRIAFTMPASVGSG